MAVKTQSTTPTPSQWASAHMHLDRRSEWRGVRIEGTRYVILPSGRTDRVYTVRADSKGCSCAWSMRTGSDCSHRLAVYLAATEDDLAAHLAEIDAAVADAFMALPVPPLKSYRDLYPGCVNGCGELVERRGERCYACLSNETRRMEMAAKADRGTTMDIKEG